MLQQSQQGRQVSAISGLNHGLHHWWVSAISGAHGQNHPGRNRFLPEFLPNNIKCSNNR